MLPMENKKIMIALGMIGALSGVVALVTYVQNREKNALQTDIAGLDRQIKMLQLQEKLDQKV